MSPRDKVKKCLRFEPVDKTPYWFTFDPEVGLRLDQHYGSASWRDKIVPYMFGQHYGGYEREGEEKGTFHDVFGSIIGTGKMQYVIKTALSSPSLKGYHWPEPEEIEDWESVTKKYQDNKASFRVCGLGYGLFERAWLMRGMEQFLMDLGDHPEFVEDLLEGITEFHLKSMDIIARKVPIEGYFGGDDWCDQRGCIMGPALWRKFFKPRVARLVNHCHELGFPYILHSCGNLLPLIDDLLEIGLDGLESLQPEAMDIFLLKKKTLGKMVLIGGLGAQSTMPFGAPDEVRKTTKKLLTEMGQGSGYVLAPAKPLLEDTPIANAVALLETLLDDSK